jgi:ATP-dependent DNA helicase RecQ
MANSSNWPTADIVAVVRRFWGFDQLRPLQEEAIRAGIDGRDSLVVLPTGGGKSLCYQVPPVLAQRTDIVISPLISLMKDQVDGLRAAGYPAAALHSGMTLEEQRDSERAVADGQFRVLFMAPERLLSPRGLAIIERLGTRTFAVDEAHCISHWGHDFRPEYRQLAELKRRIRGVSLHAYTATATERVRTDIATQLALHDPTVLVGRFDRPNLAYRVVPRTDLEAQLRAVVARHPGQAGIVYCISRRETEQLAEALESSGISCAPYHAGMTPDRRRQTQEDFTEERLDIVVATVAFGMGIDRSNVRYVAHAAMPKSVEHYQQETGRAGRDGLPAECILFYSPADALRWEALMRRSAEDTAVSPESTAAAQDLLDPMRRYSAGNRCRHRALSEYFGQEYPAASCGACDVCLDEVEGATDGTVTAQKILSCVARAGERFGAMHIVDVLLGAETEGVRRWQHEQLSTYALLKGTPKKQLINYVYQLIDDGVLERTEGERPILKLNAASWDVLRGQRPVLLRQAPTKVKETRTEQESWVGVDHGLFESLRALRRELAADRGVPPYVIFGDTTLRDLARVRPSTPDALLEIRGIGEKKRADLGEQFLHRIRDYCAEHTLALDAADSNRRARR